MGAQSSSSQDNISQSLREAVENMVFGCGEAAADARILIVREARGEGYYSTDLAGAIGGAIRSIGLEVTHTEVTFDPDTRRLPADLAQQMEEVNLTIFLARIGDQVRFSER